MKTFLYKKTEVKLITKHSDGNCLVMRQKTSETTGKVYTKRFWVHDRDLTKPVMVKKVESKPKPGVRKAPPPIKTLTQIRAPQYDQVN